MPSKALRLRIEEAERELRDLRDRTSVMESKLAALRRYLDAEEGAERPAESTEEAGAETPTPSPLKAAKERARQPATPPPLPPQAPEPKPVEEPESVPVLVNPIAASVSETDPSPPVEPAVAAKTGPTEPQPEREGLELQLGRVWFVRIGIGLLLTGIVFLSTYAYQNFIYHWPAGVRVAILYLIAIVLAGTGLFLERWKENLRHYGRVVAAGGWAAAYYVTYATHHVDRLRIVDSPVTAAILLTLCAVAFFAYAAWRQSSLLTVAALALAFYATAINPVGTLGCFSGLMLSVIAMFFFVRFRWMHVGIASLLGAYLSYAYWQGLVNYDAGNDSIRWFLLGYWLVFMTGVLVPQAKQQDDKSLALFATLNNALFFALFSFRFVSFSWVPDLWLNAVVFGGVLVLIAAAVARLPGYPKLLWQVLLPQGLALVTWGLSIKLTGYHLFISLTIEAIVLAAMWRRTRLQTFRVFAWVAAGIALFGALSRAWPWGITAPAPAFLIEGLLLVAFAFLMRGAPYARTDKLQLSFEAFIASVAALLVPTFGVLLDLDFTTAGLWMLGFGLLVWVLHLAVRGRLPLPEFVLLSQPYAMVGAILSFLGSASLVQSIGIVLVTAVLYHLHGLVADGKVKTSLPANICRVLEGIFTGFAVLALAWLIHNEVGTTDAQLLAYGVLAIGLHVYGSVAGRPITASFAHALYIPVLFIWFEAWERGGRVDIHELTLLGSLVLVLTHLVLVHLTDRLRFAGILRGALLALATLLWTGWTLTYLDHWWLALAWTGCALAFLPEQFRTWAHRPCWMFLLVLGMMAVLLGGDDFLLRYLALPTVFIVHLLKEREQPDRDELHGFSLFDAFGLLGVLAVTVVTSQYTLDVFDGKGLAICWALLGLAFFGFGLAVRQRVYRLSGLVLLGASLLHVLVVDVWKLGTLLRILSFLTLGLILLALGFVYNRWNETIRRLL